jgi:hypothetical protein
VSKKVTTGLVEGLVTSYSNEFTQLLKRGAVLQANPFRLACLFISEFLVVAVQHDF